MTEFGGVFSPPATEGTTMIADIDAMPNDAALIQRLIDEQKLTVAAIANRSGFDDKTIYGYLSGRNTLPSLVIRAAFELTGDFRLVGLIVGARPTYIACACPDCLSRVAHQHNAAPSAHREQTAATRTPPLPPVNQLVPLAVQSVKATADALDYMTRITQDGVIDPVSDKVAIEKFHQHAADSINNLSRLMAATQPSCKEAAK